MNAIAIANLTMAFINESLKGMVYQSITTHWPSGMAHMVVDALLNKYVPQDLVFNIDFCKSLNAAIMKKEEYPDNLLEAISVIENKYNTSTYQFP